jgi:hypothetical protein
MTTPVATATAAVVMAAAAAAAPIEQAGFRRLLAADEGNPHQGEENRNTKHYNAVHPRILQLLTGTVSRNHSRCRLRLIRALDGSDLDATLGPCGQQVWQAANPVGKFADCEDCSDRVG